MAPQDDEIKTLEAKCSCGSVHFTVDIPVSLLPLSTHLCHCSLCRYMTGTPCIFHAPLPKGIRPKFIAPSSLENTTAYRVGKKAWTSNFCSTCGAHIAAIPTRGNWDIATALFQTYGPELFQINESNYSKSTGDGGIAQLLPGLSGLNPPDGSPKAAFPVSKPEVGANGEDRLRAQCHCGGVSFTISRPTPEMANDEALSRFVSPIDKSKWLGSLDACDDCRLVNGTNVIGWTFVPPSCIEPPLGEDYLIGTAKSYSSSPDVTRTFCGVCGATVIYAVEDRKQVVDIAVGLLRAPEGTMAEKWLTWRAKMSFVESGKKFDQAFTGALEEGMKKWVVETQGGLLDHTIG